MALDKSTFEAISPCRFTTFTFPHPYESNSLLRIAVLDSPFHPPNSPRVAAIFVPKHRESDWIFSTEQGHVQLLHNSPGISRLILVGDLPVGDLSPPSFLRRRPLGDNDESSLQSVLEVSLKPLLLALSPKCCFENGIPEIPILRYEDNVVCSVVLGRFIGSVVGEMVVEDVEIEGGVESKRGLRRRLRFKRMPNFIQTEIPIVPKLGLGCDSLGIGEAEFVPDNGVLVHPYLAPMVASLKIAGSYIEHRIRSGFKPKSLCLGVGGGALLSFLRTQLNFMVVGVEADEQVARVAKQYFGMEDDKHITICVGDAMDYIESLASQSCDQNSGSLGSHHADTEFDAVMVDLDSGDVRTGVCAPSLDFVRKHVLLAARSVLCDNGILAMNVIPSSGSFYEKIVHEFGEVFSELYQIDVENEENVVIIGMKSPVTFPPSDCANSFVSKLSVVLSGAFMDSIRKI